MGSELGKTAIIICSYNMPEYTDALVEHIQRHVRRPYDLYVMDNGSDLVDPSQWTTHYIPDNIQMVPGFMMGVQIADQEDDYQYYWMLITSVRFDGTDERDPLAMLQPTLEEDVKALCIQPAQIIDYGAWKDLLAPQDAGTPRRVWGLEPNATLYRASLFKEIGMWREELTMGWGFSTELFWKARKRGLRIYTHDGYAMYKDTFVGYHMDRMNMSGEERSRLASEEADAIMIPIYGEEWRERLNHEYR